MKCPCCGHMFFPDSGTNSELDWAQKLIQSQQGRPMVVQESQHLNPDRYHSPNPDIGQRAIDKL